MNKEINRRHAYYNEVVKKELIDKFGYKNVMEVPKFDKIVLSLRLGKEKDNAKTFNTAVDELSLIAGQKAVVTTAKKSVANFKLREGQKIGAKVTLRGEKMYEFFDRLISVALPRVRDFQGLSSTSFDGRGNYSFGVKEQIIFPEIVYDKIDAVRGFDIMIITTAKTDKEALELLRLMGVPFKKAK
ncbi:MAG TPA: 50S ribosomal protein L5 [Candidatus Onthoplasma faecipullorum]|nr:50S ribosomal protein L5 [Candidatus Onthoplasma faecipullorum]